MKAIINIKMSMPRISFVSLLSIIGMCLSSASIIPKVGGRYIMNISYKPASSLTNCPDTAHFEVRRSAGK
jgi:hypothetical protein